jgi:hypothetical protein
MLNPVIVGNKPFLPPEHGEDAAIEAVTYRILYIELA